MDILQVWYHLNVSLGRSSYLLDRFKETTRDIKVWEESKDHLLDRMVLGFNPNPHIIFLSLKNHYPQDSK